MKVFLRIIIKIKMENDDVFPPYQIQNVSYEKLIQLSKFLMFFFNRKNKILLFQNLPFPVCNKDFWKKRIYPIINIWIQKPEIYSFLINNLLLPLKKYSYIKFILNNDNFNLFNVMPLDYFNNYSHFTLQQIFNFNLDIDSKYNDYLLKKYIFIIKCFILNKIKNLQNGLPISVYEKVLKLNPYLNQQFGNNLEKIPINYFLLPYEQTEDLFTNEDESKIIDTFDVIETSIKFQDIISNPLFLLKKDFLPRFKLNPNVKEFIPQESDENININLQETSVSIAEFVLKDE